MSEEKMFTITDGVLTDSNIRGIAHVEIPDGVTAIRGGRYSGVFQNCRNLLSVIIPEGVEELGASTFYYCTGLREVTLPSTLKTIGFGAFSNCSSLRSIVIPEGIREIGENVFSGCTALEEVVLPRSLKQIPRGLFLNCAKLETVALPEGLERIGDFGFSGCRELRQIQGLGETTELGDGAFCGCRGLADDSGFLIMGQKLFGYFGQETEPVLPAGITQISSSAFARNIKLISVTVPVGVRKISDYAFSDCANLKAVAIAEGVEEIGASAFSGCRGIKDIYLPDSVKKMGSHVFSGCNALARIRLSSSLEEIPENAFNTTALTEAVIPEGVHTIGRYAFNGCHALVNVSLPQSLKYLKNAAFSSCVALEEIIIPQGVEEMDSFSYCGNLKKINLPGSLKRISGNGFEDCRKIPYLRISEGVELGMKPFPKEVLIIGEKTFENGEQLRKSNFCNGSSVLIGIGESGQEICKLVLNRQMLDLQIFDKKGGFNRKVYDNLITGNEVRLPSALTAMAMLCRLRWDAELTEDRKQYYVEYVCKNIKKVAPYANLNPEDGLIATLEQIGALTARNKKTLLPLMGIGELPAPKTKKAEKAVPADGSKSLAQLKAEWGFKKLEDGSLCLTSYKGTDTAIEVPAMIGKNRVTVIGKECVTCNTWSKATAEQAVRRSQIISIVIPEGISEIEESAFYSCRSLETVTLPTGLKKIGHSAFYECGSLKSLTVPETVEEIGNRAFCGCGSLEKVILPDNLKNIGSRAFAGCVRLADSRKLIILKDILFQCIGGEDVVIPQNVTRVDTLAFDDLQSLKSVEFPEGLTALPSGVICRNCYHLESVTIPAGVTQIPGDALPNSSKLRIRGYSGSRAQEICTESGGRLIFESIGVMDIPKNDFEISNGILTRYRGSDKHVVIPGNVRRIGSYTKNGGWMVSGAFKGNKTVESITIPEGVEAIDAGAFADCPKLCEIHIPDSVTEVEKSAFTGTAWLARQEEAAIYAGKVLICFRDKDAAEFTVREDTVSIGGRAFYETEGYTVVRYPRLKKVILPAGVKRIGERAFISCCALEELCVPSSVTHVEDYVFPDGMDLKRCYGGVLHKTEKLPARFKAFYTGEPEDTAWLVCYQAEQTWRKAIREKMDAQPERITPAIEKMAELINGMEVLEKAVGNRAGAFAQELCRGTAPEALKALYLALKAKNHPAVKKLDLDAVFQDCMDGGMEEDFSALHPVEAAVVKNIKHTPAFEKLLSRIAEGVPYAGTDEICAPRVLAFVAYEYIRQYDPESVLYVSTYTYACKPYQYSPTADEAAAALDQQKLQEALLLLAEQYEGEYWLPYARYADEKNTVALLSKMREWDTWWKYAATGRKQIIIARSGLLLNNTRAAMIYMDKVGRLDLYASMRGTDAETIRDTVLADFGFDENREIRYDLGGNVVIVRMDDDLNLTLFDTNAGKTVKSVPKKGADPELHEKAKTAFSDLKKNIKKVITNRRHLLFGDFLSGVEKDAEKWKQSYQENPVLNSVARLLVWAQGEKTFTLTAEGAVGSDGEAYAITGEPIRVAHPIEMPGEIKAWQTYFTSRGLKQPFEQVWEPAYDPVNIREDRYEGCSLNVYRLTNKEQHGISVWGLGDYSEDYGFELTDCKMTQEASQWRFVHGVTDDAVFYLGKFTFAQYTRRVNHIVYLFDKWTITDRLLKDDVTVENMLEAFTPAQIQEFVHITTEKGCVNCTAMLLNYRDAHFENVDPLAEFTLDL